MITKQIWAVRTTITNSKTFKTCYSHLWATLMLRNIVVQWKKSNYFESLLNRVLPCFTCLRAYVLGVLTCLHAYVLGVLTCLRTYVLSVLSCLRARRVSVLACLRAYMLTCLRAYVLSVLSCLRARRVSVLACLASSRAWHAQHWRTRLFVWLLFLFA